MAKVLVGYDGSDCSRAALDTGIEVANALGDELLVVVSYDVHRFGSEVQDYAKALHWFRLAAEQGLIGSQTTLAMLYEGSTLDVSPHSAAMYPCRTISPFVPARVRGIGPSSFPKISSAGSVTPT